MMIRRMHNHTDDGAAALTTFLEKEITQPAAEALDTRAQEKPKEAPKQNTGWVGDSEFFNNPAGNEAEDKETYSSGPVFGDDEPEAKKDSGTGLTLRDGLEIRNMLQAQILAKIALHTGEDTSKYMLSDEQLDLLEKVYRPYAGKIGDKIPPELMIFFVEIVTTGSLIATAVNDRKTNKENQRRENNIKNAWPKREPKEHENTKRDGPRKKDFKLNKNGWYYNDRNGNYVKQDDSKEYPDIHNIEEMKNVIFKNGWETTKKYLGLVDDYLIEKGLDPEKIVEEWED